MSIDIPKQVNFRAQNSNIISAPQQFNNAPTKQPIDEEKSNAAKWMIGLTATAAIVIGGLYAAKHGKLGDNAEKFAKKIFGESVEKTKTNSTTKPSITTETPKEETIAPQLAIAPLVFARKGIGRLIKKPNKTLTEIMTEFQQAGVKIEKNGENLLEIRTGKSPDDITKLFFNKEGTLTSIKRATQKAEQEIFTFKNDYLSKIERKINIGKDKSLEHVIEFAQDGKVKAKSLVLNNTLEELPVNSKFLNKFSPEEVVEAFIPRDSKYFAQTIDEFKIVQKHARNLGEDSNITCREVFRDVQEAERDCTVAEFFEKNVQHQSGIDYMIEKCMQGSVENKYYAEILKLVQKDLGGREKINFNTCKLLIESYESKLNTFKIKTPEHVAIVGKPIKDCSYDEFVEILRHISPEKAGKLGVQQDPWKDKAQEQKAIMHAIKYLTGRSGIKEDNSLLEILQDL